MYQYITKKISFGKHNKIEEEIEYNKWKIEEGNIGEIPYRPQKEYSQTGTRVAGRNINQGLILKRRVKNHICL